MRQTYSIVFGKGEKKVHVYREFNTEELNWYLHNMLSSGYMVDIQALHLNTD